MSYHLSKNTMCIKILYVILYVQFYDVFMKTLTQTNERTCITTIDGDCLIIFEKFVGLSPMFVVFSTKFSLSNESLPTKWTLFPDAEGNIHNISLLPPVSTYMLQEILALEEIRLYTRRNKDNPQLAEGPNSLTYYNSSIETKILIHGWRGNGYGQYVMQLKNTYLSIFDVNVIILDWGKLANLPYALAKTGIRLIAVEAAKFIDFLVKQKGASLTKIHIIGHSLGAHMAGFIGKQITTGKLGCILGLDPASPLFSRGDSFGRLDRGDALYVEVIHTNAGLLGFLDPIGHADFYPNSGRFQPACSFDLLGICSHFLALQYMDESIRFPKSFRSTKCDSFGEVSRGACFGAGEKMGEPLLKKSISGIFWLQTSKNSPYSRS